MNYSKPIITKPLKWNENSIIELHGLGDSLFINLIQKMDTTLKLAPATTKLPNRISPWVSLATINKNVVAHITEGESFDITVNLSKAHTTDITVDFTITHDVSQVERDWRVSKDSDEHKDDFDYVAEYFAPSADADYDTTNGTITISAGDLSGSATVTTVDDALLQRGAGSFKVGLITLSNLSSGDHMIHNQAEAASVLIEDSSTYPIWTGDLELWGKGHDLQEWEPILDPDTSTIAVFNMGYEAVDDGLGGFTSGDPLMRTKIIDDIPLTEIQLRPSLDIPLDITTIEDLTNKLPFYRAVVNIGRRV